MSAFGSSVINKSSKRLAPRAPPPRRRLVAQQSQAQAPLLPSPLSQDASRTSPSAVAQNNAEPLGPEPTPVSEALAPEPPLRKKRRVNTSQSARSSTTRGDDHQPRESPIQPHESPRLAHSIRTNRPLNKPAKEAPPTTQTPAPHRMTRNRKAVNSKGTSLSNTISQLPDVTESPPPSEDLAPMDAEAETLTTKARTKQKMATGKHAPKHARVPSTRVSKRKQPDDTDGSIETVAGEQQPPIPSGAAISELSKRGPSRKRKAAPESDEPDEPPIDSENQTPESSDGLDNSINDGTSKGRRKRRRTPEGAEKHQIDTTATLMFDLTKDSRKGQKSKLEGEFQEIDWSEVVRLRKEAEARAREEVLADSSRDQQSSGATAATDDQPQGPQLKLVNGQIVLDNSSLVVDRHLGAIPAADQPAVEERDITRRINSRTWLHDNRRDPEERQLYSSKSDPWGVEATERFYDALRMWGTDFFMISKMFPGRTRRHIKLKFTREERANPELIRDALVGGSIPMNLDAYCEATGKTVDDYKDPEVLQEELKVEEERQKQEIEKQKEEQALAQRKKQEAAAAKAAAGRGKKTGDKSGAGRSRKKKQDVPASEELVPAADVVESIET